MNDRKEELCNYHVFIIDYFFEFTPLSISFQKQAKSARSVTTHACDTSFSKSALLVRLTRPPARATQRANLTQEGRWAKDGDRSDSLLISSKSLPMTCRICKKRGMEIEIKRVK
jgi:hypothetical protein